MGQRRIKMDAGSPHSMSATTGQMVTSSKDRCINRAQLAQLVELGTMYSEQGNTREKAGVSRIEGSW